MKPESGFKLRFEASLENLDQARDFIDHSGERLGVCESALGDLRLVVDEAITNIVSYGYEGRSGVVEIHMWPDGENIVIKIRDQAPWFDNQHVNAPQLDTALADRPFGGMGIFLIKKLTDENYFRKLPEGGNETGLVKKGAIKTSPG